jgi:hypothetical protein
MGSWLPSAALRFSARNDQSGNLKVCWHNSTRNHRRQVRNKLEVFARF